MAQTQQELTEQDERGILVLGGMQATESLMLWTMHNKKGLLYMLTDNFYTESHLQEFGLITGMVNQEAQGHRFPKGIDTFVDGALKNPECKGFVPLTEGARKVLTDKYKMQPIGIGMRLTPEGVQYTAYGRY